MLQPYSTTKPARRCEGGRGLRHGELTAAFYHRQALRHRLTGLCRTPEFRQVSIAALYVAEVYASAGTEQRPGSLRKRPALTKLAFRQGPEATACVTS